MARDGNPERHVHEMVENQKGNEHKERHEGMYSERIDREERAGTTIEEQQMSYSDQSTQAIT